MGHFTLPYVGDFPTADPPASFHPGDLVSIPPPTLHKLVMASLVERCAWLHSLRMVDFHSTAIPRSYRYSAPALALPAPYVPCLMLTANVPLLRGRSNSSSGVAASRSTVVPHSGRHALPVVAHPAPSPPSLWMLDRTVSTLDHPISADPAIISGELFI